MLKSKWTYLIGLPVVLVLVFTVWLRLLPDSWEVQVTKVSGDGDVTPYRISTVMCGTSTTKVFRNDDAKVWPPYFKPDSADFDAEAARIIENCREKCVVFHGYDARFDWFDMFPNVTRIEAPEQCLRAPGASAGSSG